MLDPHPASHMRRVPRLPLVPSGGATSGRGLVERVRVVDDTGSLKSSTDCEKGAVQGGPPGTVRIHSHFTLSSGAYVKKYGALTQRTPRSGLPPWASSPRKTNTFYSHPSPPRPPQLDPPIQQTSPRGRAAKHLSANVASCAQRPDWDSSFPMAAGLTPPRNRNAAVHEVPPCMSSPRVLPDIAQRQHPIIRKRLGDAHTQWPCQAPQWMYSFRPKNPTAGGGPWVACPADLWGAILDHVDDGVLWRLSRVNHELRQVAVRFLHQRSIRYQEAASKQLEAVGPCK